MRKLYVLAALVAVAAVVGCDKKIEEVRTRPAPTNGVALLASGR